MLNTIKPKPLTWDFRIMASSTADDVYFEIHKIYYSEDGQENMYDSSPTSLEKSNPLEVAAFVKIVKHASKKPILWKGDRFPDIYYL